MLAFPSDSFMRFISLCYFYFFEDPHIFFISLLLGSLNNGKVCDDCPSNDGISTSILISSFSPSDEFADSSLHGLGVFGCFLVVYYWQFLVSFESLAISYFEFFLGDLLTLIDFCFSSLSLIGYTYCIINFTVCSGIFQF